MHSLPKTKDISHWLLYLMIILFAGAFFRIVFLCTIPYNEAPDEHTHFLSVLFISDNYAIPVLGKDKDLYRDDLNRKNITYAGIPGGAYLVPAILVNVARTFNFEPMNLYVFARLGSLLFGMLTVVFASIMGKKIIGKKASLFIALILSLWPQMIFLSAYINNDAYTIFVVLFTMYCAHELFTSEKRNIKYLFLSSFASGLVVMGKATGLPILFIVMIVFISHLHTYCSKKQMISILPLMVCIFLVSGGWWIIHNMFHYGVGDPFGTRITFNLYKEIEPSSQNLKVMGYSPLWFFSLKSLSWWSDLAKSFFAQFGWRAINLPVQFYLGFYFFSTLYLFLSFLPPYNFHANQTFIIMSAFFLLGVNIVLCAYYSWSVHYQPQGKYLMNSMVLILLSIGIRNHIFDLQPYKNIFMIINYGFLIFILLSVSFSTLTLIDEYSGFRKLTKYEVYPKQLLPGYPKYFIEVSTYKEITFYSPKNLLTGICFFYSYKGKDPAAVEVTLRSATNHKLLLKVPVNIYTTNILKPYIITFKPLTHSQNKSFILDIRPLDQSRKELFGLQLDPGRAETSFITTPSNKPKKPLLKLLYPKPLLNEHDHLRPL